MVRRFGPKAVCATGLALVTVALSGFAFVGSDTPLWILIALTFVQGAGMANVVPPATESIMSSLPREKAGIGSAVSNTIRQVGGALGVAILGSLLAAVYRSEIADAVAGLPEPARAAASESVSGAYGVAGQAGPAGPAVVDAANSAFVHAMHWAAAGSAVVAFIGILVTLAWLPRRANPMYDGPPPPDRAPAESTEAAAGSAAGAGPGARPANAGRLRARKLGDRG
jgi:Na+/melibiose symporter-like transporter